MGDDNQKHKGLIVKESEGPKEESDVKERYVSWAGGAFK